MTQPDPAMVLLIPAYEPTRILSELIATLRKQMACRIVVVDDGSKSKESRKIFSDLAQCSGLKLLHHRTNLGKGAALKTGIHFVLAQMPEVETLIFADADGQHEPADILKIFGRARQAQHQLILGSRCFGTQTPLRSRLGNLFTAFLMRLLTNLKLSDTQSGLRSLPRSFARELLASPLNRYEFELDMLLQAGRRNLEIQEVKIKTIYRNANESSHFNPVLDSLRIYWVLFRFLLSSWFGDQRSKLCSSRVDFVGAVNK
jgi:glycosyltransferase involved in cell wall biosynthesis